METKRNFLKLNKDYLETLISIFYEVDLKNSLLQFDAIKVPELQFERLGKNISNVMAKS